MFGVHALYQRYIGQDDDVELREKLEDIQDETDDNLARKERAMEKITNLARKQEGIRKSFLGIALQLTGVEQKKTTMEGLLKTAMGGLETIMNRIGNRNIDMILDEMDEVGYKPSGPEGKEEVDTFKEAEDQRKKKKEETEEAEAVDDDEVSSKN